MARRAGARHHQVAVPPSQRGGPSQATGEQPLGPRIKAVVEMVGMVVAPTTLVTALLFYFGYARASATYAAFGIDQSVLGFSVRDYLLQSLNATFRSLTWLLLAGLVALWAHGALARWLARHEGARRAAGTAALAIGLLLVIGALAGLSGWVLYAVTFPVVPLGLGIGAALAAYGAALRREPRAPEAGRAAAAAQPAWAAGASRLLLGSLLVLTLFWSVEGFAVQHGDAVARRVIANLDRRPGVVVYSARRLLLEGPGVREASLASGDDSAYRFRYSGLRFLDRAGGRYFLLPDGWTPSGGARVIVLAEAADVRIELHPAA